MLKTAETSCEMPAKSGLKCEPSERVSAGLVLIERRGPLARLVRRGGGLALLRLFPFKRGGFASRQRVGEERVVIFTNSLPPTLRRRVADHPPSPATG